VNRYLIRLFLPLVVIVAMLAHVASLVTLPFVDELQQKIYDTQVKLTAPGGIDPRIVIIAIDEESLQVEGHWPWTRDKLVRLVRNLFDYGVVVTGFDAVFPERDESVDVGTLKSLASGTGDTEFLQRLEQFEPQLNRDYIFAEALGAGPTVVAYYFQTDERFSFETGSLPYAAFDFDESLAKSIHLPKAYGFTSNLDELMAGAYSAGFISNPLIDEDGIVRRTPLLHEYKNSAYESLSLAMAATFLDDISLPVFVSAPLLAEGYPPLEAIALNDNQIPVDAQGGVLVPYRGPAGSFNYISASDIINGTLEDPSLLDGAIAILGATAPGLQDLRSTPFGSIYPGVEIHANVLSGILDDRFRWQPAYSLAIELITVLVIGLILTLVLPMLSAIYATLLTAVMLTLAIGFNYYLWEVQLHVVPLAATLLMVSWIYLLNMVFGYFFETRTKHHMNDLFGQYVPPDLVSDMANDPQNYSLASEKRDLSVLFSDIRGFTSISENLDAVELSDLLNRFLTPMTEVVHVTRGTIDKYMGDAIMAFWGAPVRDPDHAANAVKAGLAMLNALKSLNKEFEAEGKEPLKIGVGVNSGPMAVGNMGSHFRRAYTVMGDAVNLGSRLEGLTKFYGVDLLVSDVTSMAADQYLYREIDLVRVKGKAKPVTIYDTQGLVGEVSEEWIKRANQFKSTLEAYRDQDWVTARQLLTELQREEPESKLYQLYLQRIDYFQSDPPAPDWDGVFTHKSK
jgi:adenylate cyclase